MAVPRLPTRPHDSPSRQLQAGLDTQPSAGTFPGDLGTLLLAASEAGGLLHPPGHSVPSHTSWMPPYLPPLCTQDSCLLHPETHLEAICFGGILAPRKRSTSLSLTAGLPGERCGEPRVLPAFFRQGSPAHTQHPAALRPLPAVPRPHSDAACPDGEMTAALTTCPSPSLKPGLYLPCPWRDSKN